MHWDTEVAPAIEGRMTKTLRDVLDYWTRLKGAAEFPVANTFDIGLLPSHLIPWVLITDHPSEGGAVIRFWGTERSGLFGADYTNKPLPSIEPSELGTKIMDEHRQVLSRREPLLIDSHLRDPEVETREICHYQALRLPLRKDEAAVLRIVSVIDFVSGIGRLYEILGADKPLHVMRAEMTARMERSE